MRLIGRRQAMRMFVTAGAAAGVGFAGCDTNPTESLDGGQGRIICDPLAPSASGTISLGDGVDSGAFSSLEARAFPDSTDGETLVPDSSEVRTLSRSLSDGVTFPYPYEFDPRFGYSDKQRWRLLAWLSKSGGEDSVPAAGEPFGVTTFDLGDCSDCKGPGTFCAVTEGVEITIDGAAP